MVRVGAVRPRADDDERHAPVGTDTGLSKNSVALTIAIGNQSFYVAVWQNKAFMVTLGVLNVDLTASKKIATNENSRIK